MIYCYIFAAIILLIASIYDIKYKRVPNWISLICLSGAIPMAIIFKPDTWYWQLGVFAAFVAIGLFGAIGAGDSKFLAGLSLTFHHTFIGSLFLASLLSFIAFNLIRSPKQILTDAKLLALTKQIPKNIKKQPFAPFCFIGLIITVFIFEVVIC